MSLVTDVSFGRHAYPPSLHARINFADWRGKATLVAQSCQTRVKNDPSCHVGVFPVTPRKGREGGLRTYPTFFSISEAELRVEHNFTRTHMTSPR